MQSRCNYDRVKMLFTRIRVDSKVTGEGQLCGQSRMYLGFAAVIPLQAVRFRAEVEV